MTPLPPVPSGALVCAIGPAGSGKSTVFRDLPRDSVVCLDELRERIAGRRGDQSVTRPAVRRQNRIVKSRLERGLTTYLDSTNVEFRVRAELLEQARVHGRPVVAFVFLTDLATCLARNSAREEDIRVPPNTVTWQHQQTEKSLETLHREGFEAVHILAPQSGTGRQASEGRDLETRRAR
ncbi:AAA family ATPase [Streptomyces microflavus]|uniref:AAA family ATPase n=1 Tax=Streptomyces microflavus TaxID=1919 RepID=UPI003808A780